ncbi:MAG: hypothetical protein IT302_06180 [Dehalococcoidia bacterium]|nr:hypothetical protein [Dehalococcoidia bacterium]
MRARGYWLFELVAWPAAAWCAIEVALRVGTGATDGIAATALLGLCAGGTIVAARTRQAALREARVRG